MLKTFRCYFTDCEKWYREIKAFDTESAAEDFVKYSIDHMDKWENEPGDWGEEDNVFVADESGNIKQFKVRTTVVQEYLIDLTEVEKKS